MRKLLSVLAIMLLVILVCGTVAFATTFTQQGYDINVEYYFVQDDMFMYLHDKDNNLLAVGLDNEGCLVYGEWNLETGGVKQVLDENGEEYVVGIHAAPPASAVFPIPEIAYTAAEERRAAYDRENQVVEIEPAPDAITFEEYKTLEAMAKEEGEDFTPSYIQKNQASLKNDQKAFAMAASVFAEEADEIHMDGYPLYPVLQTKVDEYANPWPGGTATTPRGGKIQKTWMAYVMFEGASQLKEGAIQLAPSYFNDAMFSDEEWRPYVDERYFRGDIAAPDRFSTTYALFTGNKLATAANSADAIFVPMDPAVFAAYNAVSQDRSAIRNAFITITAGMTNQQRNLHAFEHGIYHGSTSHALWYGFGGRYSLEAAVEKTTGVNRGGIIAVTVPENLNGPIDNANVQGSFGVSGIPTSLTNLRNAAATEFVKKVDVRQFGTYSASSNQWSVSQAQVSGGLIMTGYSWEFSAEKCVLGRLPGLWGQSAGSVTVSAANCPPVYNGASVSLSFFVVTSHCLDEGRKGEGTEAVLEYWPTRPRQFVVYQHELSHSTLSITDTYDVGAQNRDLSGASYRYPRYLNENILPNGNIDVVNIPQVQPFPGGPTDPRNWMPGTRYTAAFGNWGPQGINGYAGASNEDLAARGGIHDGFNAVDLSRVIRAKQLTKNGTYTLRLGEIMMVKAGSASPAANAFMSSGSGHQLFYLSVHEDRMYDQAAFDWARDKMIALKQDAGFEGNMTGDNRFSIRNRLAKGEPIPAYLAPYRTGGAKAAETAFGHATGGLLITHADTFVAQSSSSGANAAASYGIHVVNAEAHAYPSGIHTLGDAAPAYPDIHIWGNDFYTASADVTLIDGKVVSMAGKSTQKDSHPATQHMIERFSTDRARGEHISYDVRVNAADPADLFHQWGVDEFKNPRLFTGQSRISFNNSGNLTPAVVWARSQDIRLAHERQRRATGAVVPFAITNVRFFAHDEADNPEPGVSLVTFDFAITQDAVITLNSNDIDLLVGETRTLRATVTPDTTPVDRTVVWTSGNPAIATVNRTTGAVTGVSKGTAIVTAALSEDATVTADSTVVVNIVPVIGISLDKAAATIFLGSDLQLTAAIIPGNATYKSFTWSSNAPGVATVDQTGLVKSVARGSATITVETEDGFTATCFVTVATPASSITIDPAAVSLDAGNSLLLQVKVEPENVSDANVVWSSNMPDIVTVNQAGRITAVGSGWYVTITATAADGSGIFGRCTVYVPPVPTMSVTLNKKSLELLLGQNERLIATVLPSTAASKDVVWSSNSPYVFTIDQTGLITTVGAGSGNVTVTTLDGGFIDECYVHVSVPVSKITIAPPAVSVDVNQTYWLTATVEPFNAANSNVTWSSGNNSIATVNQAGIVTAVAPGTVTITAAAVDGSGVIGTCTVNVPVPHVAVIGVTLNRNTATINTIGGTLQLVETVIPNNATEKAVTWSSSNTAAATVNQTGLVTALASGNTVITVTTKENGYTATCEVYVYVNSTIDPSSDVIPQQPELPPGAPGGIVSADPLVFIPTNSNDLSLEADMLSALLPGFSSGDFRVNEYGVITLQDWLAREIAEKLLNINLAEVSVLPVFEAVLNNPGEEGAVSFIVKGNCLMVDGLIDKPENVRLLMALSSTPLSGDWFTYTGTASGLGDKMFTILDMGNNIFSGELDPDATYKLLIVIKDGGAFDLDRQEDGTIWGAMAFVGVPAMGVSLLPNHITLLTGQSFDFAPGLTFDPPIADNKKVKWSNNNVYIASISGAGLYTTFGAGNDTIKVTTEDGGHWDTSTAYISTPVNSITIFPPSASIIVNGVILLSESVLPVYAENNNVIWSSGNDAVATVNQGGRVTGAAPGTVTITATAVDGSGVFGTCTITVTP
ncbi:MAG: Ig-like domain-containing protein [Synergistaceae bacterium]|nr:Ig-like domain-containing protein [Synergistaceae bacterium]